MVKEKEGESILVPRRIHHAISDNGQFFRRMRNDHKVTIDHSGEQPPPRSKSKARSQVNGDAALPLITDQQESINSHSWETVHEDEDMTEGGDIPWVLHGSPDNIAKVRGALQRAIEQAQRQQQSSVGYLVLPDPRTYRFIIGQGGSQINSIRRQTGCKISVPRDQTQGEPIEISGSREGIEQAKDIILEVVHGSGNGGRTN